MIPCVFSYCRCAHMCAAVGLVVSVQYQVGYGLIYSGISPDEHDIRKCTGMTFAVTL